MIAYRRYMPPADATRLVANETHLLCTFVNAILLQQETNYETFDI